MNTSDNNLTADSSASNGQPAGRSNARGCGRIALGLLLLAVVAWGGWMLFWPAPDLSSSISVDVAPNDEEIVDDDQVLTEDALLEGSLLSRIDKKTIDAAHHPFDPLMEVAEIALMKIDETVVDYTGTIVSQVSVRGKLRPEQKMNCKIRHERAAGDDHCGFSVYLRFLKPDAGQEVIWVDGWNDDKLAAQATVFGTVIRLNLKPNSMLAMKNSRHPIMDIGFRNLLAKMLEKGNRDREHGECEVTIKRNIEIEGRKCVMLEVRHPVKRDHFEFHIARVYLDEELEIPIGYEGYVWPKLEGGEPRLLEKYFYTNLKLNVGLTDSDFDPANEAYGFPPVKPKP